MILHDADSREWTNDVAPTTTQIAVISAAAATRPQTLSYDWTRQSFLVSVVVDSK